MRLRNRKEKNLAYCRCSVEGLNARLRTWLSYFITKSSVIYSVAWSMGINVYNKNHQRLLDSNVYQVSMCTKKHHLLSINAFNKNKPSLSNIKRVQKKHQRHTGYQLLQQKHQRLLGINVYNKNHQRLQGVNRVAVGKERKHCENRCSYETRSVSKTSASCQFRSYRASV